MATHTGWQWALIGTNARTAPQARLTPVYQAWVQVASMADRLGRQLEGADRDRALEALQWATESVPRRYSSGDDEVTSFATWLGVRHVPAEPPPTAEGRGGGDSDVHRRRRQPAP